MESDWREVRRKGRPEKRTIKNRFDDPRFTSFYVCNLPGDTFRNELWAPCAALGNLVDIYIAGRKNTAGSFFAFIRYENPPNTDKILQGLNDMYCRGRKLKANLAKRPRPVTQHPPVPRRQSTTHHPAIPQPNRDVRSFADVAGGKAKVSAKPLISINVVPEIASWLDKSVLTGEVKNFDTLCNLPSLLDLEGFDVEEVKYLGGLYSLLKFKSVKAAEVFRANKNLWLKWFVRLHHFGQSPNITERIVWLKITGIPLLSWDESNFSTIASRYGKVLVCSSSFWNSKDTSHGRVCILTSSKVRINEEVDVMMGGNKLAVGVFEFEDNWIPFNPFFFPDSESEREEDCEMDDEELVHDSFQQDGMDTEEGEFIPDCKFQAPAVGDSGKSDGEMRNFSGNSQSSHGVSDTCSAKNNDGEGSNDHAESTTTPTGPPLAAGPLHSNGPILLSSNSAQASSPDFKFGDSAVKRRRTKHKVKGKSKLNKSLSPNADRSPLRSLDLNQKAYSSSSNAPPKGNSPPRNSPSRNSPSVSSDLNQTIEVGKLVGFQFSNGHDALEDVLNGAGGQKCAQ